MYDEHIHTHAVEVLCMFSFFSLLLERKANHTGPAAEGFDLSDEKSQWAPIIGLYSYDWSYVHTRMRGHLNWNYTLTQMHTWVQQYAEYIVP